MLTNIKDKIIKTLERLSPEYRYVLRKTGPVVFGRNVEEFKQQVTRSGGFIGSIGQTTRLSDVLRAVRSQQAFYKEWNDDQLIELIVSSQLLAELAPDLKALNGEEAEVIRQFLLSRLSRAFNNSA